MLDVDFTNLTVRVKGKGRKERIVPFGQHALKALQDYLAVRSELLAEAEPDKVDAAAVFMNYQGTRVTARLIVAINSRRLSRVAALVVAFVGLRYGISVSENETA